MSDEKQGINWGKVVLGAGVTLGLATAGVAFAPELKETFNHATDFVGGDVVGTPPSAEVIANEATATEKFTAAKETFDSATNKLKDATTFAADHKDSFLLGEPSKMIQNVANTDFNKAATDFSAAQAAKAVADKQLAESGSGIVGWALKNKVTAMASAAAVGGGVTALRSGRKDDDDIDLAKLAANVPQAGWGEKEQLRIRDNLLKSRQALVTGLGGPAVG